MPTAILLNYFVIGKIRFHKPRMRLIVYLVLGLDVMSRILIRGGRDFIDVSYINCQIEEGLRFLDNDRLRKIVHDLYRYKRRDKILYIIATAICHLANEYGQSFLTSPFGRGDFGVTNLYQSARKIAVTILLGEVEPLFVIGGPGSLISAFILATLGLRLAFNNLDFIPTSLT